MPSTRSRDAVQGPAETGIFEYDDLAHASSSVEHTPSPYQQDIYDWFGQVNPSCPVCDGSGTRCPSHDREYGRNLVVEAMAGSGKTTTILRAIDFAPESKILLAAFNKRIQEELKARLKNPRAVAQTLHSIGFRCIAKAGGTTRMCEPKWAREDDIADNVTKGMPFGSKKLVGKLVTKAREMMPLTATVPALIALAFDFDLIPPPEEKVLTVEMIAEATLRGLAYAKQDPKKTGIDYADMIFLPLVNDWVSPEYDLGVVDEAQDMVLAQLTLFQRSIKAGGRIVVVGDSNQAIYGFRGADSKSLSRLKEELNADVLPLSISYRCPRIAVKLAQRIVPHFEAAPNAIEGVESHCDDIDELLMMARVGDFVVSRKKAPLVDIAMKFLKQGTPARVQGRDIGENLLALVRSLAKGDAAHSIPKFLARLARYHSRTAERMIAAKQEDKLEGLQDKVDVLKMLAEGCPGVPTLQDRIEVLFTDEPGASVIMSTVHKVKGLEADRVFLLTSTLSKQKEEERNIYYVAVTRTKRELTWVGGKF